MSSLTHAIGGVFQPILKLIAGIMAFFYSIIPSYPVSVALLTIVVMAALTPLTVKSTKNMAAMQRLGPEMKKLQAKYKGPENRVQLNEEMMKLYKEHKVNPASGCLPMLLQMPFFFMLYSVIRGITNTVSKGTTYTPTGTTTAIKCQVNVCADPRYISSNTKMYHDIVAAHGALISGGINFAEKLLSHHTSPWAYIPYAVLVAGAVGLQYLQMSRLNARNPQAAQANPQAAMLQKYMPLIFGFIYLNVAAILNVYFIVSSAIRIGTQEVLFRRGVVPGPNSPAPGKGANQRTLSAAKEEGIEMTEQTIPKAKGTGGGAKGGTSKGAGGSGTNGSTSSTNGYRANGNKANGNKANGNKADASSDNGSGSEDAAKKQHPRSKAKKERKARRHVEWVEASGKSLAEAKETVLDMLGVAEDDAEFVVLSEPKAGLFGRLRGEARVQARVRPVTPPPKRTRRQRPDRKREGGDRSRSNGSGAKGAKGGGRQADESNEGQGQGESSAPSAGGGSNGTGGSKARSRSRGGSSSGGNQSKQQVKQASGRTSGDREDNMEESLTLEQQGEAAQQFLSGLVQEFGLDAAVSFSEVDEETVQVAAVGDDLGLLVGPRGATLSAVQDLTRTYVQRQSENRTDRILVDVGGYREKRNAALRRFAEGIADEVKSSGDERALEPMSPADRKVIHDTVNEIEGVDTRSDGIEPTRYVVIAPA